MTFIRPLYANCGAHRLGSWSLRGAHLGFETTLGDVDHLGRFPLSSFPSCIACFQIFIHLHIASSTCIVSPTVFSMVFLLHLFFIHIHLHFFHHEFQVAFILPHRGLKIASSIWIYACMSHQDFDLFLQNICMRQNPWKKAWITLTCGANSREPQSSLETLSCLLSLMVSPFYATP